MARATVGASTRARLDRATVVTSARDLLDEDGLASFSMTSLGERLGVTAMALYRHVADRADLEQALVEQVLAEFGSPEFGSPEPTGDDWEQAVAGWMRALRRCWVAHPWIGSMLAPHTELTAAWVSVLDDLARIFEDAGLPTARVAREVQYVSRTTIGILLQEVRAPIPYVGLTEGVIRQLPAGSQPRWQAIERALARYGDDDLFDDLVDANLLRLRGALRRVGRDAV